MFLHLYIYIRVRSSAFIYKTLSVASYCLPHMHSLSIIDKYYNSLPGSLSSLACATGAGVALTYKLKT
jgi:hypothetical protein